MSTVAELADRAMRDYLRQADDQPLIITLTSAVDSSETTFAYEDVTLAPDEESAIAPGVIVEFDTEQVRVKTVDDTGDTFTCIRAVNGTTAAAHAEGTEGTVAPTFTRASLIDAIKDNVVALYPQLWQTTTTTLSISSGQAEAPAAAVSAVGATYLSGGRPRPADVELIDWTPSSTGKLVLTYSVSSGTDIYFTWRGKFDRPDTDDELSTAGVRAEWERIVAIGAVAQVVAGRDLDALTAEYITEQLERDALPSDATQRIRNGLLTLYNIWINEAHNNLRGESAVPVVMYH